MSLSRREFLQMLALAGTAGMGLSGRTARAASPANLYDVPAFGNVSLLHFTDCHAQLMPVYFREPNINLGVGGSRGKAPHLVGDALLKHFNIAPGSIEAHALTYLNFDDAARQYGKIGGFAHMATLVKKMRASRPGRTLLLDGGDTWQGSATALWTNGQDMVDACKLLGVDMMTGHWEFTYGDARVKEIVDKELKGKIEFLAQNVFDTSFGEERVFKPYVIREVNKVRVAVIGQAFPYTPIANNRFAFPNWSFGIRDEEVQKLVNECRKKGAQVVVVLSHNGMDVDLKMASRVRGIDAILGGHTHDAMPGPTLVPNAGGKTLVINSGSNTKYLSVLDLDVRGGKVADFRFKLLPVFSNLLPADKPMADLIAKVRAPYKTKLEEKLAVTESLLYRRGNFNGTIDQMIVDALMEAQDAEIAFSPGFRWGTTLLPGDAITFEHVMDQTAITYGTATLNNLSGEDIKTILEDIADNLFNPDPYYQQGGDMVRVGGLTYTLDLNQPLGKRISDMEVRGEKVEAGKKYKVAGWASVQPNPNGKKQIWDLMADWLRDKKTVRVGQPYVPKLKGKDAAGNPGIA
ncbi:MAG: thiosulfohydrolase SoxB [Gammaproteobacteria bacterium]|nr:MAG: thiosulfohydrolase SoxB [Gammaproteobacteria bacterium]